MTDTECIKCKVVDWAKEQGLVLRLIDYLTTVATPEINTARTNISIEVAKVCSQCEGRPIEQVSNEIQKFRQDPALIKT